MRKTRIIDVTKRGSYMEQRKAYLDAVNAAREAKKEKKEYIVDWEKDTK